MSFIFSSENSVDEKEFSVACEGKLTVFSEAQPNSKVNFSERSVEKLTEPTDIISFDIGIKNMCFCILHPVVNSVGFGSASVKTVNIIDWNIINLMENPETFQQTVEPLCSNCNKKAKFIKQILPRSKSENSPKLHSIESLNLPSQTTANSFSSTLRSDEKINTYYCLKHAKKTNYLLPSKQFTKGSLNKLKKNDLINFCHSKLFFIEPTTNQTIENLSKPQLVDAAVAYFKNSCLLPVSALNSVPYSSSPTPRSDEFQKKKVSGNTDLVEIGWNMKKHLDKIPDSVINNIKYVIIENQISPIANRMKTIQGMLAQYFIMRCDRSIRLTDSQERNVGEDQFTVAGEGKLDKISIHFVSSKNKLKGYISKKEENINDFSGGKAEAKNTECSPKLTEKQKYKQNKNDAIIYCNQILNTNENMNKEWGWTMKMPKKDDYADCFLQGYWFMNEKSLK
jgi:hypothetical protein